MNILLAALLFIILSPGLIVTLPPAKGGIFATQTTTNIAVVLHAVIFFIIAKYTTPSTDSSDNTVSWPFNFLVEATEEISQRDTPIQVANIVATILFIVMSPGVLLTVPPDEGGLVMSQDTNIMAVLVHGAAFYVVLKFWESYSKSKDKKTGNPDGNIIQLINDQLIAI
jgi:hypothetical protein